MEEMQWKNEELKKLEEGLPRLQECHLEEVSRLYKVGTGGGCDGFHLEVPLDLRIKRRKSWTSWRRWSGVESGRNKPAQRCFS